MLNKEMFFVGGQHGSPMQPCIVRVVEETDGDGILRVTPVSPLELDKLEQLGGNSQQYVHESSLQELDEDGNLTDSQIEIIVNHKEPFGQGDGVDIPVNDLVSGDRIIITSVTIADMMQGALADERATVVAGIGQSFIEHPMVRPEGVGEPNTTPYAIALTDRGVVVMLEDANKPQKEKV